MDIICPSKSQALIIPPSNDNKLILSDEELKCAKELYYHERTKGTKIYKYENNEITYLGFHTGYAAIAHNGKCKGEICINNNEDIIWISGKAISNFRGLIVI